MRSELIFTWDENTKLNKMMSDQWKDFAEELFLTCLEIYMADSKKNFIKDPDFIEVVSVCSKPEKISLNSLEPATELLAVIWRSEKQWSSAQRVYHDDRRQEIQDSWKDWLGYFCKETEGKHPEIISHVVQAVAFKATSRGEMIRRNLQHLLEELYLGPLVLRRKEAHKSQEFWSAERAEWKKGEEAAIASRKAEHAQLSIVEKITLYLSKIWQEEKIVWANKKHERVRNINKTPQFIKGVGIVVLCLSGILISALCLESALMALGWSQYVPYAKGHDAPGITFSAITVTATLFIAGLYIFVSERIGGNKEIGIKLRPLKRGFFVCLLYVCISALIDILSHYYLYSNHTKEIWRMGLLIIYIAPAWLMLGWLYSKRKD
jgi:hypothetical protein